MVVEQFLAEVHVVGQLTIERETEPLVLLDVVAFERLGIAAVVLAAGGVAHVADRRPARIFLHQALVLAAMVEPEHLAHVPHLFVGVNKLVPMGIISGHAGRQLAAVLDVQKHARH